MSDRNMRLDVVVSLRDRLSAGLGRLRQGLQRIADTAKKIGLVGTAIAGISFMGPIQEAAAFQQKLIDISLTQGLIGQAAFQSVKLQTDQYEDLALRVGQVSDTVAAGAGQMTAAGVAAETINASLSDIGRAATAANAEFSDMASVATSMMQTLEVPASQLRDSLGALVTAGKLGAFELKDMATYFPQLTSGVAKFGVKGREAVDFLATGLQIAKKGASDAGAAANNFNNFLSKALAPITIKNFAGMGVDIEAVMKDAAAKGINPIEAMLQKIMTMTSVSESEIAGFMKTAKERGLEGADALGFVREQLEAIGAAGKIGNLFGDMQVLDFLIPFMANVDEFKDIKRQVAEATGAAIDGDFETQMQGLNRQLIRFGEIGTQAVRFVGLAFGQWLPMMGDRAEALLRGMRELDAATGGWVSQGLVAAGGAILLVGALGALGLALPIVAGGISAIAAVAALALSPIGLVIAAIAGGAALIWRNWDRIGPRMARIWDGMKAGLLSFGRTAMDAGRSLVDSGRALVDRYGPAIMRGVGTAWESAGAVGRRAIGAIRAVAGDFFARTGWSGAGAAAAGMDLFTAALGRLRAVAETGLEAVQFVLGVFGEFLSGFASRIEPMGEAFSGVISAFGNLGSALGDLSDGIARIAGTNPIDWSGIFGNAASFLGQTLANAFSLFAEALKFVIDQITWIVRKIGDLVQSIGTLDAGPVKAFADAIRTALGGLQSIIDGIGGAWNRMASAVSGSREWLSGVGSSVSGWFGGEAPKVARPELPDTTAMAPPVVGAATRQALNDNAPAGSSSAVPAAAVQRVDAGGVLRIQVDGPGRVTDAQANDRRMAIVPDRGRAVGRE